ncbi:hypothetical protein GCM10020256_73580 [Streptomyces thermocoprophilus]
MQGGQLPHGVGFQVREPVDRGDRHRPGEGYAGAAGRVAVVAVQHRLQQVHGGAVGERGHGEIGQFPSGAFQVEGGADTAVRLAQPGQSRGVRHRGGGLDEAAYGAALQQAAESRSAGQAGPAEGGHTSHLLAWGCERLRDAAPLWRRRAVIAM